MSVDLSGPKVGTAWRVRTSYDSGVLFVRGPEGHKQFVVQYDQRDGWDNFKETGLGVGGIHRIEQILHELKPVADITAADLDGRIIETSDGGKVLFADGHAILFDDCDGFWVSCSRDGTPKWADRSATAEKMQAAYAAELDRRRNPPLVIQWQGAFSIRGVIAQAWCEVHGEIWRITLHENRDYRIYQELTYRTYRDSIPKCEQYIRDHYATKDRATST